MRSRDPVIALAKLAAASSAGSEHAARSVSSWFLKRLSSRSMPMVPACESLMAAASCRRNSGAYAPNSCVRLLVFEKRAPLRAVAKIAHHQHVPRGRRRTLACSDACATSVRLRVWLRRCLRARPSVVLAAAGALCRWRAPRRLPVSRVRLRAPDRRSSWCS
jgi:hypothetical protein